MARTRTTKTVAQRIDLNYFKRPTPYKRARLWLAILAPLLAAGWLAFYFVRHDARVYSSGRLSAAHAVLEQQCAACHVQQVGGFAAAAADSACLACHDGPVHHPLAATVSNVGCAECHAEHRGRVRLTQVRNQSCAVCHGDLAASAGATSFARHISSLRDGHPEFAALRPAAGTPPRDPGTIKLNHALHMRSIRSGPNGPTVQLECGDCHKTAGAGDTQWRFRDVKYASATVSYTAAETFAPSGAHGLPGREPWSDRQLMAPPRFANACAGCHQLTFDRRFDEGVPHDRPEVVHGFLRKKFADYIAAHPAELHEVQEPQRNLTGKPMGPATRSLTPAQWVAERVAVSEELLWHKTCSQCHAISATALQDVKIARWDAAGGTPGAAARGGADAQRTETPLPSVAAANITLQWLPHARFDHDAHAGFTCLSCHRNTLRSSESGDVLIPGIAICQTCHAPGAGYANANCSECHVYHDWSKRKEVTPGFTLPALQGGGE